MTIVYILGTDGAGKTLISRRLAAAGVLGDHTVHLYCQHRPLLVWLVKFPARLLFLRKADQFRNYESYKEQKDRAVGRRPWLAIAYAWLGYFDAWLQTWPKVMWARVSGSGVILDRYYLDWVVNAGVLQNSTRETMLRDARILEHWLPKADLHVFLDVDERTAFARKDDIQSLEYLRERKKRYHDFARYYDFKSVDANQCADAVFLQTKSLIDAAKPINATG